MKKTNKPYQSHEDAVIVEELQNYPQNFSYAFDQAAKRLPGRSKGSVSGHFYSTLKKKLNKENMAITAVGSNKGLIVNSKTVMSKGPSEQLLMIQELVDDNLTAEEKKALIKYAMQTL